MKRSGFATHVSRRWAICARRIAMSVLAVGAGYLLRGAAFAPGVFPLGMAFVSALPCCSVAAATGVLLRSFAEEGDASVFYGVLTMVLCIMRIALAALVYGVSRVRLTGRIGDAILARVLLCSIFALGYSLLSVWQGGFSLHDVFLPVIHTIAATSFSLLFCFFFEAEHRFTPAFEAGLGAVAFSLSLSLVGVRAGIFSLGFLIPYAITLYIGWLGQPMRSAAVGLLCGLACAGGGAPVFALAGLVAGIFFDVNGLLAVICSASVMVCGTLYFDGMDAALSLLPEITAASVLVGLPAALRILPSFSLRSDGDGVAIETLVARRCEKEQEKRMETIAGSMNALSSVLHSLSERFRRPDPATVADACREIWRRHCAACPNDCAFRELDMPGAESVVDRLTSKLMASGKIDRERLYEITRAKCPMLDRIAMQISEQTAKLLQKAIQEDRTRIFALDYEAMAQMFADAAARSEAHLPVDRVLSERLRKQLARAGVRAENVIVCGDRKKFVIATGEGIVQTTLRPSAVRDLCEAACKTRFLMPEFMLEDGKSAMTLEGAPCFSVEYAGKQVAKRGESICADSVSVVNSYDDRFYCFICDGMGSGDEAAVTSRMCRVFLEKMLACGNKKSITLEMLNNLICSRSIECFATVDLLEIDLVLGVASFMKSGAVPSYVIRGKHLYKIASGAFPIGIMPQVSAEMTEFDLCDEDVIVLCSDGVASDIETCENGDPTWFVEFIEREWTDDLGIMAEKIMLAASDASSRSDDMTVELIRVRKIKEDNGAAA